MKTIVITGASSGIGEALALEYAAPGVLLAITGRDAERLESVATQCRAKGAEVTAAVIDVRERERMASWLAEIDDKAPVSLVVANAGIIAGQSAPGEIEDADAGYRLLQTNVLGAANTVQPLIPRMIARKQGQIALMSSIAAFVPLAHAPSYSASKAALLNYGKSLRDALRRPGYVETRMSREEEGAKPFLMRAPEAAKRIRAGLESNREIVTFPWFFSFLTRLSGMLPSPLRRAVSQPFKFSVKEKKN
jgi:short-subunit dehydrogenase